MSALGPPLRVRTRSDYTVPFLVDLGQRNATFVKRKWAPLRRVVQWADAFAILPEPDFDIVHAVNSLPILTRRPYVLTFEDYLPRVPEDRYVGWLEARLMRDLLSPRCVALLGISEYALRQFRHQARDFARRDELEAKLELLYPAIAPRRTEPKQQLGDRLRLLFVGRDFMHKGGPALIGAHERLRARGVPVETTIVSQLRWNGESYIGPPSAPLVEREHARLATTPGVTHHRALPNAEVLRLMDEADFFVFPTLHDTFGYVALEALASATPVLATAVNALPEVVDDSCGSLLPLPHDPVLGRWAWSYRTTEPGYLDAYETTMRELAGAIADRLSACWETPGGYGALSAGALARIDERFDVGAARERLEQLYERCRERMPRTLRRPARSASTAS